MVSRRMFLRAGLAGVAGGLAGCSALDGSQGRGGGRVTDEPNDGGSNGMTPDDGNDTGDGASTETPGLDGLVLSAREIAGGFTSPVGVEVPEPGRRYIVDQDGRIYLHTEDGLADEPFLDVRDRMISVSGFTEQGLLGLAFHPNFAENGRFFVRYSAPPRSGTPSGYTHTFVLSEFRADPDAVRADPDTEQVLLEIPEPQFNHNAGAITFGPDGYLYIAVGDGGKANDQGPGHVEDWYDAVGGGNGQDTTENLLGSVLRIDVDGSDGDRPYAIPDDNPLVGEDGLDEHYAWGFRNPWRMSFGPDGRLFVADVGQSDFEEVNVVERGGNYGWNVREGTHCFSADECPSETPDGEPLIDPIIEYPHGGPGPTGISVIGGYLYDGDAIPTLQSRYVFADWRAQGRLFVATERDSGLWPITEVPVDAEDFGPNVLSFGRTPEGELLVCTTEEAGVSGSTGKVFRLESA
ncbi:MAG: sorbosone dehydrogenase family protein [Haloarculaceae archaeon]